MRLSIIVLLMLILPTRLASADTVKDRLRAFLHQKTDAEQQLNPTIDNKAELLRRFPTIAIDAKTIIDKQGVRANSESEFHILIYYHYLIDDHGSIADMLNGYLPISAGRSALDYLDMIYFLPGMLHERLGQYDVANIHYHRYFSGMKTVLARVDLFNSRAVALKMTLTRIKMMALNAGWQPPSNSYYTHSYYAFQQDSLFSRYTRQRQFLQKYRDKDLMRGTHLSVDYQALLDSINTIQPANRNLYDIYELCAMSLYVSLHSYYYVENMSKDAINNIKKAGQESCNDPIFDSVQPNHPVYALRQFALGRLKSKANQYAAAQKHFELVGKAKSPEIEFLKDDALFYIALLPHNQNTEQAFHNQLRYIIRNFNQNYDAVAHANNLLR